MDASLEYLLLPCAAINSLLDTSIDALRHCHCVCIMTST